MTTRRLAIERLLTGILGALLVYCVGWRWNIPLAAWLSAALLMRSFRLSARWAAALPLLALSALARWASISGGWEMELTLEFVFSLLVMLPLWAALYLDRWLARAGHPARHIVFALVYTAGDYLLGFTPVGSVFSPGAAQFALPALAQAVSLAGIWGLTFLIGAAAAALNQLREVNWDLRRAGRPALALALGFALLLAWGYARPLLLRPASAAVRVAGITEAHPRDYWAITDAGTPRESKAVYAAEMAAINERLFASSARAAAAGAKIIFWSEGAAVVYEDDLGALLARAADFAREHRVYLAPAVLNLRYGLAKNDNTLYLFGPDGGQLWRYEKTISWYPTESDGIVPAAETPYGTLAAVICFDLDFPRLVRQAYAKGADILLVPGYDTAAISPYHTQIGLLRGVEFGLSVFRQAADSTSMAADYLGNVLAAQDYFATADRMLLADLPTRGVRTLYGALGDWLVMGVFAALVLLAVLGSINLARRRRAGAGTAARAPQKRAASGRGGA